MNHDGYDKTGVLVVDDDVMLRRTWARILTAPDFDVTLCGTADEALDVLSTRQVDVVITDVDMPGMTGLELLDRIKQDDPTIEVVVMSGLGRVSDMTRAARAGAYAYVAKPFHDVERCVQMVRRAGRRSRRRHESHLAT